MRSLLFLITSFLIISCTQKNEPKSGFEDKIIDLVIENANGKSIEFPEIYDSLTKNIPEDNVEKLILVEKLKSKGFKVINSGRGNYPPLGPRIVIFTLKKENCECEVAKIYYSTISDSVYNMTERISCKKASL